jgi:trigger factor
VLDGKSDLSFDVSYEVLPPVTLMEFKGLSSSTSRLSRSFESDVDAEDEARVPPAARLRGQGRRRVVEDGDRLGLSFKGTIKGKEFAGGSPTMRT